jgi:hypothetical protein
MKRRDREIMKLVVVLLVSILVTLAGTFGVAAPVSANGEAPLIQSFDETRTVCELSFVKGSGYILARSLLATRGFAFGSGVPEITVEALQGVDIFVINLLATPLSVAETHLLEAFVRQGGAILDTRNLFSPSLFGVSQTVFNGSGLATIVNRSHPDIAEITEGVFSPVNVGASSALVYPPDAIPFLREIHGDIGVVFPSEPGRFGRFVVIGDEEIFINAIPCPASALIVFPNNQRLLTNLFDYLAAASGPRRR